MTWSIYNDNTGWYTNCMSTIKTAVSIEESLFRRADELAGELQVSRSRLISIALERLIREYETKRLMEKLNEVYADGPTKEDEQWLEIARQAYVETLGDEKW